MDFLTGVYLFYSFVSFYFLTLFILVYVQNKSKVYECPPYDKVRSLSIVVPCYNEEKSIGKTIEHLVTSDYPGLKKIYVVDDCSTDGSYAEIKKYSKKYPQVVALQTPKNSGRAAGAKNYGAKFVDTELIGFSDADSFPNKKAMSQMIGFFNDEGVGAVTSRVLVEHRRNLLEKFQAIEYKVIAFTRKLLGFIESIYVTNGPLSIYRKKAFDQVDGFDEVNLTEDIEITWHFVSKGWRVCMAIPAKVYTVVPNKISDWLKQRIRWNVGGMQTLQKYRKSFFRCGMLGKFILPFFTFSWILGITGLFFLFYRLARYFILKYLALSYSVSANVVVFAMDDINMIPNVMFIFGMILFSLSMMFTFTALIHSKEREFKRESVFVILSYSVFYLLIYPVLLITSVYKFIRGKDNW